MIAVRRLSIALLLVFTATGAFASWYDDYDAKEIGRAHV